MAHEAKARAAFNPKGTSTLSVAGNPRRRAPFPRMSAHMGLAPKGAMPAMVRRTTPRSRVIPEHPVDGGHIT